MGKKLYVGNLTYNVNESDLEALFTPFGTVQSAQVIVDRDTNRSKGFGFVEMGSDAEAQAAIQGLNGREHDGRNLTVNEAKPREERGGGGGGAATVVAVVEAAAAVAMAAVAVGVIDRSILPHGQGASQRGFLIDLTYATTQREKPNPVFSHLMSSKEAGCPLLNAPCLGCKLSRFSWGSPHSDHFHACPMCWLRKTLG